MYEKKVIFDESNKIVTANKYSEYYDIFGTSDIVIAIKKDKCYFVNKFYKIGIDALIISSPFFSHEGSTLIGSLEYLLQNYEVITFSNLCDVEKYMKKMLYSWGE